VAVVVIAIVSTDARNVQAGLGHQASETINRDFFYALHSVVVVFEIVWTSVQ
jgi:hypothetical protein